MLLSKEFLLDSSGISKVIEDTKERGRVEYLTIFNDRITHFNKGSEKELIKFFNILEKSKSKDIDAYIVLEEKDITINGLFCIVENNIISHVLNIGGVMKFGEGEEEPRYLRFLLKYRINELDKEFSKDIVKNIICNNYSFTIDDFKLGFEIPKNLPDDVLF